MYCYTSFTLSETRPKNRDSHLNNKTSRLGLNLSYLMSLHAWGGSRKKAVVQRNHRQDVSHKPQLQWHIWSMAQHPQRPPLCAFLWLSNYVVLHPPLQGQQIFTEVLLLFPRETGDMQPRGNNFQAGNQTQYIYSHKRMYLSYIIPLIPLLLNPCGVSDH